jgi:MOSC domain-containing protein YiiM
MSFSGQLVAICVSSTPAGEMRAVDEAEAVAGVGLAGDRYAAKQGTFSRPLATEPQDVTLIEVETLDAVRRDFKLDVTHAMTRRNLLTVGVPLNHLVGKDFAIGDVVLRGFELCEPCSHLQKLTIKEILKPLVHRGGLRAEIVRGGTLRVGQLIRPHTS